MNKYDELQALRAEAAELRQILARLGNRAETGLPSKLCQVRDLGSKPTAGDLFIAAEVMRIDGDPSEGAAPALVGTEEIMILLPVRYLFAPDVGENVTAKRVDNRWVAAPRAGCFPAGNFNQCVCDCRYPYPGFAFATDGNGEHRISSTFNSKTWTATYTAPIQTWTFVNRIGPPCRPADTSWGKCVEGPILNLSVFITLSTDCTTNEWVLSYGWKALTFCESEEDDCLGVSPPSAAAFADPIGLVQDRIPIDCDRNTILEFEIPTGVDGAPGTVPINHPGPYPTPGGGGPVTVVFDEDGIH